MENSNKSIATTTLNANQISKADYFGYSSVLSKESTKLTNFVVTESDNGMKVASWTMETKNKSVTEFNNYKCEYDNETQYKHGSIGRYLQSVEKHKENSFLHSFGNSPILSIEDVATVFNIPVQLLTSEELQKQFVESVRNFALMETNDTKDLKSFVASLERFGLIIDKDNEFSAKIQSLTSIQKNYVYFKESTSTLNLKRTWNDSTNLVLTLRFDNDSDKKSYAFTLESMLTDCSNKIKSSKVQLEKFSILSKEDKKDFLFECLKSNLTKYKDKSINMELKLVLIEKENEFDLDSLLD